MNKSLLLLIRYSLFFAFVFSVFFAFLITIYTGYRVYTIKNNVYPGVYINSIDFSSKNKSDIISYFDSENRILQNKNYFFTYKDRVATFSGKTIMVAYNSDQIANFAYAIGRQQDFILRLKSIIHHILLSKQLDIIVQPSINKEDIYTFLNNLYVEYKTEAEDAVFEEKNGKVTSFKIEKYGKSIEIEKTMKDFYNLVYSKNNNLNVFVPIYEKIVSPKKIISSLNNYGIKELIGEGSSDYSGSSSEREFNILLSASKLHGTLIPPNSIFSYNKSVGEVSSATGYKTTYIIKDGRTILGDGGGICNTSTVMFRAALNTGLPILERHAHSYRVRYYENDSKPGLDATVYAPSVDFKFNNDTSAYILLQVVPDEINNILSIKLYGKKDGRSIIISPIKVWDVVPPPEPLYQDDPTLKRGVTKQVDFPAWGTKATFHYTVTLNNKTIQDKEFFSGFKPWKAIYLVGTGDF